ncbi:hypothetical protein UFOVP1298_75 [uncultured Caudovirales phage]|uniref:Portal protein n=1 Tax=uncultured Caudovirales phage TaxID=2100421 RepID=A0A6J5RJV8_9CAUD|nr:hypothetical protein UFOVP1298_75 [uncultured Caudovirales phage]
MTQVYQAIAPVSADVSAAEPKGLDNSDLITIGVSGHINACWNKAKFAKQRVTERLLQCERQRRGEYDPDKAQEIAQSGGSDIYMMITDVKCNGAKSWIQDVLFQDDRGFSLVPSQEPSLPPEIKMSIVDLVQREAEAFLMEGQQMHPEAFRERMAEVHDQVLIRIREEAKECAERMSKVIQDQMDEGNYKRTMEDFIDDFVTYPTAILKGPTVRKKKRLQWGPNFTPIVVSDYFREVERVSPYDMFPSPNSSGVDDGFLIQRHRLDVKTLESFRGVPGYSDDDIDQVLARHGHTGYRYYDYGDQQRDNLEGKYHSRLHQDGLIEALEFWGPVMGDMLAQWGMKKVDPQKVYEINAWQIGSFTIKIVINPDPLGRRPYEIAAWRKIPGAFWNTALPEIMRDVQMMTNASARALANNMGIASGPQVDVSVDRLADGEELTQMFPWKIWQTTSDRTGGGQPAVRFFMPDMKAAELMGVYNQFAKQADEVTGIPNYIYGGGAGGSGAGRTASGLSMLMDNAAKGIKAAILSIDHVVSMVVSRFYVHNMMYNPDPYIKGDFRVISTGAMGLVHKEQIQVRRNEFLAATANPVDLQIVGPQGRAYLLRELAKGLQMDTDKLVPSQEVLKFRQGQIEQAMQSQIPGQQQLPAPAEAGPPGAPPPAPINTVQPQQEIA